MIDRFSSAGSLEGLEYEFASNKDVNLSSTKAQRRIARVSGGTKVFFLLRCR